MAYGDLPLDVEEKPNKGQEGGACNRRSCQAEPALYFNHGTPRWYCEDCARDIGDDDVNRSDWMHRFFPRLGHFQFETREQVRARGVPNDRTSLPPKTEDRATYDEYDPGSTFQKVVSFRPPYPGSGKSLRAHR